MTAAIIEGEWIDVQSSNIARVSWTRVLKIEFRKNGRIYRYVGVPEHKAVAMVRAPSVGKYFHAHIRDQYEEEEVDE
jgi:hypothetical protein